MASKNSAESEKIAQLCTIAGVDKETAENLLDACAGNLEMAINMAVDNTNMSNSPSAAVASSSNRNKHHDIAYLAGNANDIKTTCSASTSYNTAALPLIDVTESENVRAPIPKKREVLVDETYHNSYGFRGRRRPARSVFDGFRDFRRETRVQEAMLSNNSNAQKLKTLEDLFRPPVDMMHKGSFESARETGQTTGKWLMVNIQNVREFPCQVLNRDVWSSDAVRLIIQEHFIFWQVYHDSSEGERFMQFYKVDEYPYIAILDPRTGENLTIWHKLDAAAFCENVTNFLSDHPSMPCASPPVLQPAKKKMRSESILDASEDSQLEAAIVASLDETKPKAQTVEESDSSGSEIETFSDSGSEVASPAKKNLNESHKGRGMHSHMQQKNVDVKKNLYVKDKEPENSDTVEKTGVLGVKNGKSETEWKKYLGPDCDSKTNLMIRFPDGKKTQLNVPSSSRLMSVVQFAMAHGYSNERYELVTNFPKRKLSYMDFNITLKDAGLFPQETIFVQER